MLCDLCKKNEATIHIQQVAPGEKKVMHICSECAASKFKNSLQNTVDPFELAEMFSEILNRRAAEIQKNKKSAGEQKAVQELSRQLFPPCGECGWTLDELQRTGQVGCAECYRHFKQAIQTVLSETGGGSFHKGKTPVSRPDGEDSAIAAGAMKLAEARAALSDAVLAEDFEKAAELRDAIVILQKKLDAANSAGGKDGE